MSFSGFGGVPRKPGGKHQPLLGPVQGVQPGGNQKKHQPNLGIIPELQGKKTHPGNRNVAAHVSPVSPPPHIPPPAENLPMPPEKLRVSCILTSYNRPTLVRQALKSLQDQTYKKFEVVILDDSNQMNIQEILSEFNLPVSQIFMSQVTPLQRRSFNRLSVNINRGLAAASGDLVCFLCDDDYYFPKWFEEAVRFFLANPGKHVGYGRLIYSKSQAMEFNLKNDTRWPGVILTQPYERLDHNQVIHRRFPVPFRWPEDFKTIGNPDAHYFRLISAYHQFHPINAYAAVKRLHKKNLQGSISDLVGGRAENIRE